MRVQRGNYTDIDDHNYGSDTHYEEQEHEDIDDLVHRKRVRRMLEEKLERKRLKEELEDYEGELDDEFNWDNIDRK